MKCSKFTDLIQSSLLKCFMESTENSASEIRVPICAGAGAGAGAGALTMLVCVERLKGPVEWLYLLLLTDSGALQLG